MSILNIQNLTKHFIGLVAVDDVSFDVEEGSIYGIIGPNGAGKTTTFNMIAGAIPKTSGTITFMGQHIDGLLTDQVARSGISRTFQNTRLFKNMTVAENILVGGLFKYESNIYQGLLGTKKARKDKIETEDKVIEMLEFFDLFSLAPSMADSLAYGHQRLLEMARALVSNPKLLLLDEPSAGMNPTETVNLMQLISKIRDMGVTIIVIEHDMKFIKGICDRVMVLNYGIKIAEGTAEAVLTDPNVVNAYLGGANKYV